MSESMTRQELKHDALATAIIDGIKWIKGNRSLFTGITSTLAGVILLTSFFLYRSHISANRAQDKLSMAQGQLYSAEGADQGMRMIDEVINQYSKTSAALKARLVKAEFLQEQHQYDEAEKALLPVLQQTGSDPVIPLALQVIATIREDAGKLPDALQAYQQFLEKYPDHFLAPKVYESIGRVYELSGKAQEAKRTYEKLSTLYPASGWAQRAQERLSALGGTSSAQPATPVPAAPSR